MNWPDFVVLGLVALSAVMSGIRGVVRESISLASWVLAFWGGMSFATQVSHCAWLSAAVSSPSLRLILSFIVLFLGILLVGGGINFFFGQLIKKTKLTALDKLLGVLFGVARGILLISFVIVLARFTVLPHEKWWSDSLLIPYFNPVVSWFDTHFSKEIQSVETMMRPKKKEPAPAKRKNTAGNPSDHPPDDAPLPSPRSTSVSAPQQDELSQEGQEEKGSG